MTVAVAPNGGRRSRADHPALPITAEEVATAARACRDGGASMIHLHVRDDQERHSLDPERYKKGIKAVRRAVGDDLVIQVTTEAIGIYQPDQQMDTVRALRPEAVSMAIRELIPDPSFETAAAEFFTWLRRENVAPQYIVYTPDEFARLNDLRARGIIPGNRVSCLFVLGFYGQNEGHPDDLLPYLAQGIDGLDWSVCAFGRGENACAMTAAALGGHVRVGFENNLNMCDGSPAPDNAALVAQLTHSLGLVGCHAADAAWLRQRLDGLCND